MNIINYKYLCLWYNYKLNLMKKKALIYGVTGQDGSYLTELLLKKKLWSSWG